MDKKHTPGPWSFWRAQKYVQKIDGGHRWIGFAKVYVRFSGDTKDDEEGVANARLIAAAPDLLEALCDMVSDRENLSEATMKFALSAIAKARGEA